MMPSRVPNRMERKRFGLLDVFKRKKALAVHVTTNLLGHPERYAQARSQRVQKHCIVDLFRDGISSFITERLQIDKRNGRRSVHRRLEKEV